MTARTEKDVEKGPGSLAILGLTALYLVALGLATTVADPTYRDWGRYLETLAGGERAALGLAVGAGAALPALLLVPRRPRRVLGWPVGCYLLTACYFLFWAVPSRGDGGFAYYDEEVFRAQAGWYVVTSLAAFFLATAAIAVLIARSSPPREADPDELTATLTGSRVGAPPTGPPDLPTPAGEGSAFQEDMHEMALDETWLVDIPLGTTVHREPWDGRRCSAQLTRWFDAGLITLYQDADDVPASVTWETCSDRGLPVLDPVRARALLRDPRRWVEGTPDGSVCVAATDRGRSAPVAEWHRA